MSGVEKAGMMCHIARLLANTASSGCSAAWLARLTGGQKVAGSNPVTPTSEAVYLQ